MDTPTATETDSERLLSITKELETLRQQFNKVLDIVTIQTETIVALRQRVDGQGDAIASINRTIAGINEVLEHQLAMIKVLAASDRLDTAVWGELVSQLTDLKSRAILCAPDERT